MSAIPIRMNFVTGTDKREKRHVRGFRSLLASHRNIKVPEYRLRCNPSPEKVRPFYSPYLIYIYNGKFISVSIPFTFSLINRERRISCVCNRWRSRQSRGFFFCDFIQWKSKENEWYSWNFLEILCLPLLAENEGYSFNRVQEFIILEIFFSRDDRTRLKFPSFRSIFHSFRIQDRNLFPDLGISRLIYADNLMENSCSIIY